MDRLVLVQPQEPELVFAHGPPSLRRRLAASLVASLAGRAIFESGSVARESRMEAGWWVQRSASVAAEVLVVDLE